MPSCDPNDLLEAAKCLQCFDLKTLGGVKIFLLCALVIPVPPTPDAPTNPDIDATSTDGHLIVTWTQTTAPDTNEVWVSRNGGAYVLLTSVAGNVTQAIDATAMANLDQWTYKIRAVKGGNSSAFTSTVSAIKNFSKNATADVTFSFPDLVFAIGGFTVLSCAALTSISAPLCHTFTGALSIQGNNVLASVNLASLKTMTGGIIIFSNPLLSALTLNTLISTGGSISITSNAVLAAVSLPALTSTGANLNVSTNGAITSISIPALTSLSGSFDIGNNASLTSINFLAIQSIGLGLTIGSNPLLSSVTMNALQSIGGGVAIGSNSGLNSISFPSLTTVVGTPIDCSNNLSLTTASFPSLGALPVGCDFLFNDCTLLNTISVPAIDFGNNTIIDFSNDALLVASVDQVLRRGVLGTLTGADIEMTGGTNATPGVQGLLDKAALIIAGNTVNTN